MASMDQTQSYGKGCILGFSQVSQKGTSPEHMAAEHKYSYGNACTVTKNNSSTGEKTTRKAVTTIFFASVCRQKVQH